jgi:serine O-acetyltransferase
LSIAHQGTIVVNSNTKIGKNCRIHVCVNIGTSAGETNYAPVIGDNAYKGSGVKIYGNIKLGNNIAI